MRSTAHLQLGVLQPDGTRAATVTDQGGLLVHGAIVPAAPPGQLPALANQDVAFLVAVAARAPSVHNTQPWQFRASDTAIDLYADPGRKLPRLDPAGRELMISCGAALFGLRIGMRKLGILPRTELLPDPANPWFVGRVHVAGRAAVTRTEAELIAALPHRHTHRGPFSPGEVPARLLAALQVDAAAERSELVLVQRADLIADLARLVRAAAAEQQADGEIMGELQRWVQPTGSAARDGVPARARVRSDPDERDRARDRSGPRSGEAARQSADGGRHERLPQRDFGLPGLEEPGGGEGPSATVVLTTPGDTAADWIAAGQALHRLLLHAATRWVFASMQTQPLESPRHREQLRELLGLAGQPQMLLQFGRANTAPATARRPQAELMTNKQPG